MAPHTGPIPDDIVREIVVRLACFDSPTTITKALKEEYEIELTRQQVFTYDPKRSGKKPAKEWIDLFTETRQKFLDEVSEVGISHKAVRLRRLEMLVIKAIRDGNSVQAAALMEQAAKEMGEVYTNRRQVTGNITVEQALRELDND